MSRIDELLDLMRLLRDPERGCPWDRVQTFRTIAPHTIEEAHEVADAIARGDLADLCDELGDLLFQIVFHARMAEEEGHFAFDDVVGAIVDKMVRRHPHVFETAETGNDGQTHPTWEEIKAMERAHGGRDRAASVLDTVTRGLPALALARAIQKKAAHLGLDWPGPDPVAAKVAEELGELRDALDSADVAGRRREEFGDLLFSCVNLGRHLDIDPDLALRESTEKFETRARRVERAAREGGIDLAKASAEEVDRLWRGAKVADDGAAGGG